ncbi:unnamed protein product [Linum trigynum]|uniref:Uncharacterized protein n=1 Tax=Linum trigynum TaxID=586398 RepID=A0AAV2E1R8_9ROSI
MGPPSKPIPSLNTNNVVLSPVRRLSLPVFPVRLLCCCWPVRTPTLALPNGPNLASSLASGRKFHMPADFSHRTSFATSPPSVAANRSFKIVRE